MLSIVITLIGGDRALLRCRSRSIPASRRPALRCRSTIPGPAPRSWPTRWRRPIEQQVNGVEGMLYMSSQMGNDGSYTLTVTFDLGTD